MIHPTRTRLLQLKARAASLGDSIAILRARRQALIRELLSTAAPFLTSREALRRDYRQAIDELLLSRGIEGEAFIESLVAAGGRQFGVEVAEKNVLGVRYLEVAAPESPLRTPEARNYDYSATTPHLEEALFLFEKIVAAILETAAFEERLKRLGAEIGRVTRRTRVLEERLLPRVREEIRAILQYLGEREREDYFRLKRFKKLRGGKRNESAGVSQPRTRSTRDLRSMTSNGLEI